jgi:outer membrane protein
MHKYMPLWHIRTLFLSLLLLSSILLAQEDYSFRIAYGKATTTDLGEVLSGNIKDYDVDYNVLAFDAGYLVGREIYDLPIDIYVKGGLAYFPKVGLENDILESTLYIKAYWNIDFWENRVRIGFGEGLSYTSNILMPEYIDAVLNSDNNSHLLNYLDISVDFDFGRLIGYKPLYSTAVGVAIKHRSGVFSLFNNVSHGGSNYNTFYIEKNF